MKLIVQSDDYGITRAAALGALEAIRNGVVRNTGFFTNMPWAEECYEWIKPYEKDIAFGIDLNASTGSSVLGFDRVPNLCHEDGSFYTSKENRELDTDENDHDHVDYDQIYAEFEAQILKFEKICGRLPDYIHNHAYGTKTTMLASRALAEKYRRPWTTALMQRKEVTPAGMGWYAFGGGLEEQLHTDPAAYITSDRDGLLKNEYGYIVCHCGYVDADLFKYSSFNICRANDVACMTGETMKNWIRENHIELISFKDLPEDWY